MQPCTPLISAQWMRAGLICVVVLTSVPVLAQDIRGLEVCTAEKDMNRRTSCLQSNVEFLQQTLDKQQREANRRIAASEAEITALKSRLSKLEDDLAQLKKPPAPAADTKK